MRADEVAEEERVIESKLTDLNADPTCNAIVPITNPECQGFADTILYTDMRLSAVTLLPLIGNNHLPVEKVIVRIGDSNIPIRWNRFFRGRQCIPR